MKVTMIVIVSRGDIQPMRRRAEQLGKRINAEDGVGNLIAHFEHILR